MSYDLTDTASSMSAARKRWFAAGVLLVSLLAHLIMLDWASGALSLPAFEKSTEQTVTVELQSAPAIKTVVTDPKPLPTLKPAVAIVPVQAPPVANISNAATDSAVSDTTQSAQQVVEQGPPPLFERISLPPAATLTYDVTVTREGSTISGYGTTQWQTNGNQYSITGDAGVLFFTLFNYKSTGSIDGMGLSPELYVEKRFRKSETNTHFHRERKAISFSASTNTYPSKGGEQDRASVIWQLAALGRGDGGKFEPGLTFEVFIAGSRTATPWRVVVEGRQMISTTGGDTETWHLLLIPAERSYEKQFELWLAPQKEWYPVKLRYADHSGGHFEMLVSKISAVKNSDAQ